ncbi:MAG: septum formation initiator family protein [Acidimicrobiia bacterium]|nr:septum formation initiator family protein [Acidimicrobiia bacterium]
MTARSRLQTALPIFLLVILAAGVTNVFPFRQMIAQDKTVDHATERLESLEAENARLQREADALLSGSEMERLARSELGYVMPGEVAYVITAPSDETPAVDVEPALPERRTWYQSLWGFLTGEDLVEG